MMYQKDMQTQEIEFRREQMDRIERILKVKV